MSFFKRISTIDSRVIFTLTWMIMAFALIVPIGLPIVPSQNTIDSYELFKTLKEGDILFVSIDYDFSNKAENYSGQLAGMRIALQNGARVITTSMWPSGGLVARGAIEELAKEFPDKVKGVDYLHLGYKPGGETYIAALMTDVFAACAHVDDDGKPLSESPIIADFPNLKAATIVNTGGSGSPGVKEWIPQFKALAMDIPYIGSIESVSLPQQTPNLQAGYFDAIIPGMRGSAEMEQLTGNIGMSSAAMDAQSMVHLFVIILIALGNLNYYITKKQSEAEKAVK